MVYLENNIINCLRGMKRGYEEHRMAEMLLSELERMDEKEKDFEENKKVNNLF